jgi:hypothetical protein
MPIFNEVMPALARTRHKFVRAQICILTAQHEFHFCKWEKGIIYILLHATRILMKLCQLLQELDTRFVRAQICILSQPNTNFTFANGKGNYIYFIICYKNSKIVHTCRFHQATTSSVR